jgi:hypothetical protein
LKPLPRRLQLCWIQSPAWMLVTCHAMSHSSHKSYRSTGVRWFMTLVPTTNDSDWFQ